MRRVIAGCLLAGLGAGIQPAGTAAPDTLPAVTTPAAAEPIVVERRVRYTFTLHNRTGTLLEREGFSAYAPVKVTATQRLIGIDATLPATAQVDALGNQLLHFTVDALPPYSSRVVSVEARLAVSDTPRPDPLSDWLRAAYTRPERYVESDNARIVALARALQGKDAHATARNIHHWVRQNLQRLQYTPEDLGALRALSRNAGDCTEHAYLFVALARAAAIPARALGGFVMPESGVLDPRDYHNWAEFYADGTWHLADTHRGVFDRQASHYLAMRLISSAVPSPLGSSHRYAGGSDALRITMN